MFGDEPFYLAALALIYLLYDKRLCARLMPLLISCGWLNYGLKCFFASPRPPASQQLAVAYGYGFPSGHAQTSACFWSYLSLDSWSLSLAVVGVALVALVSASRVLLGVHYLADVVAGVVVGLALALSYWLVLKRYGVEEEMVLLLTSAAAPLVLLCFALLAPPLYVLAAFALGGGVLGFALGYLSLSRFVSFEKPQNAGEAVLRLACFSVFATPLAAIYLTNPYEVLDQPFGALLLYFLIAFVLSFATPLACSALKRHQNS